MMSKLVPTVSTILEINISTLLNITKTTKLKMQIIQEVGLICFFLFINLSQISPTTSGHVAYEAQMQIDEDGSSLQTEQAGKMKGLHEHWKYK